MEHNLSWTLLAGVCAVVLLVVLLPKKRCVFPIGTRTIDLSSQVGDGRSVADAISRTWRSGDQVIVIRRKGFDEVALPPSLFHETRTIPGSVLCNEVTYDHVDDTSFPVHTRIRTASSTAILRKILNGRIANILPDLAEEFVSNLNEIVQEHAESTIADWCERLSAGISARFVYGVKGSFAPDLIAHVIQDPDPRAAAAKAHSFPIPLNTLYAHFSGPARKARTDHRQIWNLTHALVRESEARGESVSTWYKANVPASNDPATEQEHCRELYIVYWDAYQSFYANFAALFYDLATAPSRDVEILRSEAHRALDTHGSLASKSATAQLVEIDGFLKESHRMHPLGHTMLHRRVRSPLTFSNGLHLVPGTLLSSSTYALFRDETRWPDPETFDPRRYSRMREKGGTEAGAVTEASLSYAQSDATFPMFGTGSRICPAMGLAGHVMKIALAEIVLAGEWSLEGETLTLEEARGLDLGVILQRRVKVRGLGDQRG